MASDTRSLAPGRPERVRLGLALAAVLALRSAVVYSQYFVGE